mgnify:CR=1 FL=1
MVDSSFNPERNQDNLRHLLVYEDLRDWIAQADRLGELREVNGANWEQDIGLACTVVKYDENSPVLLFDNIPGVKPGFRVLANFFGGTRKNMTLGFPENLSKVELSEAWADVYSHEPSALIPPVYVENGPIFENIKTGDEVDMNTEEPPGPDELRRHDERGADAALAKGEEASDDDGGDDDAGLPAGSPRDSPTEKHVT